ncbi:MAG: TIGR00300 family protein, partial [Candidatus Methanoculleus thermohydrogenotrophicum]
MESCREIELEGHIIDSGVMTLVFDKIMDMGGEFEILTFEVGKLKTDTSYARLRVSAPTVQQLDAILSELHRFGARTPEISDVILVPAEGDRILPKGFYSTTNHPTFVKYQGEWLPVERIEMDCHI